MISCLISFSLSFSSRSVPWKASNCAFHLAAIFFDHIDDVAALDTILYQFMPPHSHHACILFGIDMLGEDHRDLLLLAGFHYVNDI